MHLTHPLAQLAKCGRLVPLVVVLLIARSRAATGLGAWWVFDLSGCRFVPRFICHPHTACLESRYVPCRAVRATGHHSATRSARS